MSIFQSYERWEEICQNTRLLPCGWNLEVMNFADDHGRDLSRSFLMRKFDDSRDIPEYFQVVWFAWQGLSLFAGSLHLTSGADILSFLFFLLFLCSLVCLWNCQQPASPHCCICIHRGNFREMVVITEGAYSSLEAGEEIDVCTVLWKKSLDWTYRGIWSRRSNKVVELHTCKWSCGQPQDFLFSFLGIEWMGLAPQRPNAFVTRQLVPFDGSDKSSSAWLWNEKT